MPPNPRVSLRLREASCANAALALGQAASIPLELPPGHRLAEKAKSPHFQRAVEQLEARRSFDWPDTAFADALRELCQAYSLEPSPWAGGYLLLPHGEQWSAWRSEPEDGVPRFESQGFHVYPLSVTVVSQRTRDFVQERRNSLREHLHLTVGCRKDGEDADRIAGVSGWAAEDDLGHVLTSTRSVENLDLHLVHVGPYPDQWRTSVMFSAPAPGASQLTSVQGDLLIFEDYQVFSLEISLPLPDSHFRTSVGDLGLELVRFEEGYEQQDPSGVSTGRASAHHSLQARLYKPAGVYVSSPGHAGYISPILVGKSGRPYEFDGRSSGGISLAKDEVVAVEATYIPRADRPAKVVFQLTQKSCPTRRLSFRLADIPLP